MVCLIIWARHMIVFTPRDERTYFTSSECSPDCAIIVNNIYGTLPSGLNFILRNKIDNFMKCFAINCRPIFHTNSVWACGAICHQVVRLAVNTFQSEWCLFSPLSAAQDLDHIKIITITTTITTTTNRNQKGKEEKRFWLLGCCCLLLLLLLLQ